MAQDILEMKQYIFGRHVESTEMEERTQELKRSFHELNENSGLILKEIHRLQRILKGERSLSLSPHTIKEMDSQFPKFTKSTYGREKHRYLQLKMLYKAT